MSALVGVGAGHLEVADVAQVGGGGPALQPPGAGGAALASGADVTADFAHVPGRPEETVLDLLVSDPDVGAERLEAHTLAREVLTRVDGPRVRARHHRRLVAVL